MVDLGVGRGTHIRPTERVQRTMTLSEEAFQVLKEHSSIIQIRLMTEF
jgi:hypothetical protein